MVLAHNLTAMNAQRQFNIVGTSKKKSTEKLSSGYKINRAADDAAGLTISEKMRSQIRGLHQASENCQDGVSYVQVADGALNEVQDMLHRMTELSVKAANGTNTDQDRAAINEEMQQITSEIQRIFTETEFNTKKIWEPDNRIELEPTIITTEVTKPSVTYSQKYSTSRIDDNNKYVVPKSGFDFSADEDGITISWTGYDGNSYESNIISWSENIQGNHKINLSDNMDYEKYPNAKGIDFVFEYNVNADAPKTDVISALDAVHLSAGIYSDENINFYNTDGTRSNIISGGFYLDYDAELVTEKSFTENDDTFVNGETFYNPVALGNNDEDFSFSFNLKNIGAVHAVFRAADYSGSYSYSENIGKGLWWNESSDHTRGVIFHHASPDNSSLNAIFDSIDDSGNEGDSLWENNKYGGMYNSSFDIYSDSEYIGADGTKRPAGSYVGAIGYNVYVSKSGYSNPEELKNAIKDSIAKINSYILDDKSGNGSTIVTYEYKGESREKVTKNVDTVVHNYLYLDEDTKNVNIHAGATGRDENTINITYDVLNVSRLGLQDTNVLNENEAKKTIDKIEKALSIVSEQRSYFGATQNRIEHTIANLDNIVENTQAAESRIRDTDMATEMVNNTKLNILEQAVTSMMAQANQSTQGVLSLLQ